MKGKGSLPDVQPEPMMPTVVARRVGVDEGMLRDEDGEWV